MTRLHTHYDNLQVVETASPEVIKGAYKHLCQKWHPDKHPNRVEAEKITKLLNEAYEVLSDEEKRCAHDAWIAAQRSDKAPAAPESNVDPSSEQQLSSFMFIAGAVLALAFVALFQLGGWLIQVFTSDSASARDTKALQSALAACHFVTNSGHIDKDGNARISVSIQNDGADSTVVVDAGFNVPSGSQQKSQKLRLKSGELKSVEFHFANVSVNSHDTYWFRCAPQNQR